MNSHWSLANDLGVRVQRGSGLNILYIRPYVSYRLSQRVQINAGFADFYSPSTGSNYNELRPWEGIKVDIPLSGRIVLNNYTRVEERWIFYKEKPKSYLVRFRHVLGFTLNWYQNKDRGLSFYTPFYSEIFEDLNDRKTIFINRARLYGGVGFSFGTSRVEIFYVPQYTRSKPEQDLDLTENILRLRLYKTF